MVDKIDLQPAGFDHIPASKAEVPAELKPVTASENKKGIEQLKDALAFLLAVAGP